MEAIQNWQAAGRRCPILSMHQFLDSKLCHPAISPSSNIKAKWSREALLPHCAIWCEKDAHQNFHLAIPQLFFKAVFLSLSKFNTAVKKRHIEDNSSFCFLPFALSLMNLHLQQEQRHYAVLGPGFVVHNGTIFHESETENRQYTHVRTYKTSSGWSYLRNRSFQDKIYFNQMKYLTCETVEKKDLIQFPILLSISLRTYMVPRT